MLLDDFKAAAARASSKGFPEPSSNQKLQLYGLYKQATKGSGKGSRPGVMDPVGRAKFDAWAACAIYDQEQAKSEYINLVKKIDPSFTTSLSVESSSPRNEEVSSEPTSPSTSSKATVAPLCIVKIDVPKYTDLEDDQGFRFTVYNIRVTQSDGKVWTIGRRYNEVYDFYMSLSSSWKNSKLKNFKFPNKSMLNTFSSKTLERRRTGFIGFFNILLELIAEGHEQPIAGLSSLLNVPSEWFANNGKGGGVSSGSVGSGGRTSSNTNMTNSSSTEQTVNQNKSSSLPLTEQQIEEQSLRRKKRVDSQRGFSITRFISTFIAVLVGIAASGGAGFFDLMQLDITRAMVGALLITLCAILLVDFMFMRNR